jgi:NADH dehydrogenase FAD-containing subunit
MASKRSDLHRIVVVGGGAGGLELVTRVGDKLGRRKLADVTLIENYRAHLWKPLLHEVAAGSMDLSVHEIDFLAQAHWHHFRYRIGESIGLTPWRYRDFGSLVSLGEFSTVGSLMGGLMGRSLWIEGLYARLMYRSLYKMHEYALHGPTKVTLDTLARLITRRSEPHVKLH